jgi:hypothetical protein
MHLPTLLAVLVAGGMCLALWKLASATRAWTAAQDERARAQSALDAAAFLMFFLALASVEARVLQLVPESDWLSHGGVCAAVVGALLACRRHYRFPRNT